MAVGMTGFTHLFNAMRVLDSREPGPIAAALESPDACYGLIVDGIHVAPAMLRLALRGAGRPMLVTDAMPPVGGTVGTFQLNGQSIMVRDGRCTRQDGRLAGACLDMASAVRNCVRLLDVPLTDALRFASTHPAHFLGLGDRLGELAPGMRADMVAIDPNRVEVHYTWVAGEMDCRQSRALSSEQVAHPRNHLTAVEFNTAHDLLVRQGAGAVFHLEARDAECLGCCGNAARHCFR